MNQEMMGRAIRVDKLSKLYQIGARQELHPTLRDTIAAGFSNHWTRLASVFGRSNGLPKEENTVWALRDVSFEVQRGEVVGIIGANGAGKSTLLKILSRITEPTEGTAEIRGRVASLLEIGTGFHLELTGRDNIYLNGAILGMKKSEIDRHFDEIVAFSEIEKFIDTPVKHYSSGMYLRLAFGVAAHMNPEILLVDEVLAVGDVAFQKKCLGKLGDVSQQGRTSLFVSHNLDAILHLVHRVIVLHEGRISFEGPPAEGVSHYLDLMSNGANAQEWKNDAENITVLSLKVAPLTGSEVRSGCGLSIQIEYQSTYLIPDPLIIVGIRGARGESIYGIFSQNMDPSIRQLPLRGCLTCETGEINLTPGYCYISLTIWSGENKIFFQPKLAEFFVEKDNVTASPAARREWFMAVLPSKWSVS